MASTVDNASEDILQSVLDQAFLPPRLESVVVLPVEAEAVPSSTESVAVPEEPLPESSISSGSSDDSWKAEYESQIEAWRAQSSEAREKAEKERERWEAIRAAENKEAERRGALGISDEPELVVTEQAHEAGWEEVAQHNDQPTLDTPEVQVAAQSRDVPSKVRLSIKLKTAQKTEIHFMKSTTAPTPPITAEVPRAHSQADTKDGSQKWEDVHASVTSSYPSLEYPERTETPSPSHRHPAPPLAAPLSATLAIFDSTLTTRTRVKAVFSSLAINLFLPFVNGVMLGFGEIFAKNVVMRWFGWKPAGPGFIAATAGISAGVSPRKSWGERQ
ncbi:hypothetical protein DXG01_004282 [Tephrocybe rancida]|nr:hypothetical protein DXG01_004282 [Tephrocybe rancida]